MTVQELIDTLNKVEDKTKEVIQCDGFGIEKVIEHNIERYDCMLLY